MPVVIFSELETQNQQKIALAQLNSPKTHNALNLSMIELLYAQLLTWQNQDDIALIILEGAGDKAFCAGGDVVSLYHHLKQKNKPIDDNAIENSLAMTFFSKEYQLDLLIHQYQKPIMVWGDGYIMGGGIGLFAGASHRITTENSQLAMPEISIGLYPDVGASWFLNQMPEHIGLFLGLTGALFNGFDAQTIGLADYVLANDSKEFLFERLLAVQWQNSQQNHTLLSDFLAQYQQEFRVNSNELESQIKPAESLIARSCTFDNVIDIYNAIVTINSDNEWFSRAQKKLQRGSPLSAHLIYQQLQLCKERSIEQCFNAELNLSLRCCQYAEFSEGVRALLVDKDKSPDWRFKKIEHIPQETLQWFFTPIGSLPS